MSGLVKIPLRNINLTTPGGDFNTFSGQEFSQKTSFQLSAPINSVIIYGWIFPVQEPDSEKSESSDSSTKLTKTRLHHKSFSKNPPQENSIKKVLSVVSISSLSDGEMGDDEYSDNEIITKKSITIQNQR